jgi:hypothetical protein
VPQVCQTWARNGDHQLRPKVGLACGESRLVEDTTAPSERGYACRRECLIRVLFSRVPEALILEASELDVS